LQILLKSAEHPTERLAFFAADAATELGAEHFVDLANAPGSGAAGIGDINAPYPPVGRVGMTPDEVALLKTIDHGADRCPPNAEMIGELGLRGGTKLGDVPDETGLGEVEVKWDESGVERFTDKACRGHQRRFDAPPRRGVEFVVGQTAHWCDTRLGAHSEQMLWRKWKLIVWRHTVCSKSINRTEQ